MKLKFMIVLSVTNKRFFLLKKVHLVCGPGKKILLFRLWFRIHYHFGYPNIVCGLKRLRSSNIHGRKFFNTAFQLNSATNKNTLYSYIMGLQKMKILVHPIAYLQTKFERENVDRLPYPVVISTNPTIFC